MSVGAAIERKTLRDGLPSLGKLTMWLWAWGLMMLLTLFVRAIFGTLNGAVGWFPFANKVVQAPIHKIEQKVSNYIGGAVQNIDAHIATSWHTLAAVVRGIPSALVDDAGLIFGLAAALVVLPSQALVRYLVHVGTMPIHAAERQLDALLSRLRQGYKGVAHFVGHNIWARLLGLAAIVGGIIAHDLPALRARERALERDLDRLWKWARHRKLSLTTGAFLGAFVWALGKLGLRWIRCSKVGKIGNQVCKMDNLLVDALLLDIGLLTTPFSLEEFTRLMRTPTRELLGGLHYVISEVEEFTNMAATIWTKGSTANPTPDL